MKTSKHVYNGPAPDVQKSIPCDYCGLPPYAGIHVTNGGVVCDMDKGPCCCGAWHDLEETRMKCAPND